MKKIQRQISKFNQKQKNQALDLQIAQLFQCLDMRGSGKLTRKQLKGILFTHGRNQAGPGSSKSVYVSDGDINAVMRRMDANGDEEISFSDYFTTLLPYFIYGDLQKQPTMNQVVGREIKQKQRDQKSKVRSINKANRAVSASAAQRRKPSYGQPNFFQQNSQLIENEQELSQDEFLHIRNNMENKHQMKESMGRSSS